MKGQVCRDGAAQRVWRLDLGALKERQVQMGPGEMSLLRPCGGSQCPHKFGRTQAVAEGMGFWVVVKMFWVCVP